MKKSKIVVSENLKHNETFDCRVDFKSKSERDFRRYIGLGSYCTNPDGIYFHFPPGNSPPMEEWRKFFNSSNSAIILLAFHELVTAYRDAETPEDYAFGQEICKIIKDHERAFSQFIYDWFEPLPESNFFFFPPIYRNFRGLNFNYEGIEDQVEKEYCDEAGNIKKVRFRDGAILKLANSQNPDAYLNYQQFFIPESGYGSFINDLIELAGYFFTK